LAVIKPAQARFPVNNYRNQATTGLGLSAGLTAEIGKCADKRLGLPPAKTTAKAGGNQGNAQGHEHHDHDQFQEGEATTVGYGFEPPAIRKRYH
jgi:hypothetical protein